MGCFRLARSSIPVNIVLITFTNFCTCASRCKKHQFVNILVNIGIKQNVFLICEIPLCPSYKEYNYKLSFSVMKSNSVCILPFSSENKVNRS